jgi:hypothetical protein
VSSCLPKEASRQLPIDPHGPLTPVLALNLADLLGCLQRPAEPDIEEHRNLLAVNPRGRTHLVCGDIEPRTKPSEKRFKMIATTWGAGQVAYSILWFFLLFIEIWLAISIFIDIFRSHDLKGWAKAAWLLLVFVLPIVGILAYLIFRGDTMRAHQIQAAQDQQTFQRNFLQYAVGQSPADELSKLLELKNTGALTEAEFEKLKAHVIDRASQVN